ncbi:MAG: hypothetical protein HY356_04635 [Gammaproteobacteria bacterium]|nr:hypothetical protein [Gammaproteobacteria bacterium]
MKLSNNQLRSFITLSNFNPFLVTIICLITIPGCEQSVTDYFPLGNGLKWEYSILESVNKIESNSKLIIANLQEVKINDITYYPRKSASGHIYYFFKRPEGIYYSKAPGSDNAVVLRHPLQRGVKWRSGSDIHILKRRHESFAGGESFISLEGDITLDYTVKSAGEAVEVLAGRFSNCVRIESSGTVRVEARTRGIDHIMIEQTEWYAPGIGLVKSIRKEFTIPDKITGEMIQELVSVKSG